MLGLKDFIEQILNENIDDYKVCLACNVKGKTNIKNTIHNQMAITEFLSENEFEEYIDAFQSLGIYTTAYFYVEDFVKDIDVFDSNTIVLETSQRGTGRGRDSLIPSLCEIIGVIYSGCNAYLNSLCSNKYHWSKILEIHNITIPNSYKWLESDCWLIDEKPSDWPCIIKPIYECASIGIDISSVKSDIFQTENHCKKLKNIMNQPLIVQQFIFGYEIEVPIISYNGEVFILPPVGLQKDNKKDLYDKFFYYDIVYEDSYDFYLFSEVSTDICKKIEDICKEIVDILDIEGYLRIDFRVNQDNEIAVFDINPYPHIVKHSSFSYSFVSLGFDSKLLIPFIAKLAKCRFSNQTKFEDHLTK